MMRAALATAVLLALLAAPAHGGLPESSTFELDGVDYQYVAGVNGTQRATLSTADGPVPLDLQGCAFVMLHPGTPNGRVLSFLRIGDVPLESYLDQLRLPNGTRGYHVDEPTVMDGKRSVADLLITGNATLRVDGQRYPDPVGSTGDADTDRDLPDLVGTATLLRTGVEPDTAANAFEEAPDELHLRIANHPDAVPTSRTYAFASPGDVPPLPSEDYGVTHSFPNSKVGGRIEVDIQADALGLPGSTSLRASLHAPDGRELANATLEPFAAAPDGATLAAALTEFGTYTVRVTGTQSFATYQGTATLHPPESFELRVWWENVTFGAQAYDDLVACKESTRTSGDAGFVASFVNRPQPPRFHYGVVVASVAAVVALAVVLVKLASEELSLAAFRKMR